MIMNKVDLNNLTYYGNEKIRVNWKDSIGEKIPCSEKSLDIFGVHISKSSISEYLRGKNMTAKGYTFSYVN